jgi:hypothetical protein
MRETATHTVTSPSALQQTPTHKRQAAATATCHPMERPITLPCSAGADRSHPSHATNTHVQPHTSTMCAVKVKGQILVRASRESLGPWLPPWRAPDPGRGALRAPQIALLGSSSLSTGERAQAYGIFPSLIDVAQSCKHACIVCTIEEKFLLKKKDFHLASLSRCANPRAASLQLAQRLRAVLRCPD